MLRFFLILIAIIYIVYKLVGFLMKIYLIGRMQGFKKEKTNEKTNEDASAHTKYFGKLKINKVDKKENNQKKNNEDEYISYEEVK